MRQHLALLTLIGALSVVAASQGQTPTLKVGSDAPQLKATFVKGDAVHEFKKGSVYVVEFWATWCGPCREIIPHLTELAKKYEGKASIIGVSVWEDDQAKVEPFVKKLGDKMDYYVAIDDQQSPTAREGQMSKSWLEAAGIDGIPSAFVVDQDSKIAWMGPSKQMEDALEKIVSKTWDRASYAKAMNEEAAKIEADSTNDPIYVAMNKFTAQVGAKQYDEALKTTEVIEKSRASTNFPEPLQLGLSLNMSVNLKKNDMAAWYKTGARFAEAFKNNPTALSGLAWQIANPASKLPERRGKFAVKVAKQAAKASGYKEGAILDALAWSYHLNGQHKLAVETEKKALACKLDDDTRKELTANLAKLRKG